MRHYFVSSEIYTAVINHMYNVCYFNHTTITFIKNTHYYFSHLTFSYNFSYILTYIKRNNLYQFSLTNLLYNTFTFHIMCAYEINL